MGPNLHLTLGSSVAQGQAAIKTSSEQTQGQRGPASLEGRERGDGSAAEKQAAWSARAERPGQARPLAAPGHAEAPGAFLTLATCPGLSHHFRARRGPLRGMTAPPRWRPDLSEHQVFACKTYRF